MSNAISFAENFLNLFILSAPWLILGFTVAALIKLLYRPETMQKHLGGTGVWVTIKAALIGAPLPLCSCGVVPAALGLHSAGASKNATVSFLVATPETGVDSVAFTYALMGPVMAITRPIAAITSAIVAGLLVGKLEDHTLKLTSERNTPDNSSDNSSDNNADNHSIYKQGENLNPSPYSKQQVLALDQNKEQKQQQASGCCASKEALHQDPLHQGQVLSEMGAKTFMIRVQEAFRFSFGKMLRDIVNWLIIGLVLAALVQTFLPDDFFHSLGNGFLSMFVMALIGIPMYVCASASTPIAAGFLLAGLSPGAVLVFMLLGPASNIGTIMIVKKALGNRAVLAYFTGVVLSAFAFGFGLNYLIDLYDWNILASLQDHQHESNTIFDLVMACLLLALVVHALIKNIKVGANNNTAKNPL